MKTITLDLNLSKIPHTGTHEQRQYQAFKVSYTKGKRAYITLIKDGYNLCSVAKLMQFKEGNVLLSFGKEKINIGTYSEQ
jgi:hypothetical protein